MPTTSERRSSGFGASEFRPVLLGKGVEPEEVLAGVLEQPGDLRRRQAKAIGDLNESLTGFLASVGLEDLADRGRDHWLLVAGAVAEHVP